MIKVLLFLALCLGCVENFDFNQIRRQLTTWIDWALIELPRNPFLEHSSNDVSYHRSQWNYLVFSLSWPAGYCIFSKCTYPRVVNSFNIHGLWPTIWPRTEISDCAGAPAFNNTNVVDIFEELQKEWADEKDFEHPWKFWEHEWSKHGSCAIQDKLMPDQYSYFLAALSLKNRIGIANVFERNGVKPSNSTEYTTESVISLIKAELGVHTELACEWIHDQLPHLVEVRVCVNRDLKLIDCPEVEQTNPVPNVSWTSSCLKTFIFAS